MADQQDPRDQHDGDRPRPPQFYASIVLWAVVLIVALYFLMLGGGWTGSQGPQIPYNEFKTLVKQGRVAEVTLRGHAVRGKLLEPAALGPKGGESRYFNTRIPEFNGRDVLPLLEQHNVQVHVAEPREGSWVTALIAMLPWILIIVFGFIVFRSLSRGLSGGMGQIGQFMRRSIKRAEVPDAGFEDVAGQEHAKHEVSELVDYLKDPRRFRSLGAQVPKGVLLLGPPGTGKTLLARALAGEAEVPFYSISGSEFIEVFVGVGASRVRNLFEEAKKNAPAIIFIDELDAIGRRRGAGLGGGHDEREQTLNQILAQMDGFEPHEAVIVLAATNRADVLDAALLRPGRFDRHVTMDLPDRKDRKAILEVHTRKVPLQGDVDLGEIAGSTPGFSGADLRNLVNEAAILAAREASKVVRRDHLEQARDKVTLGPERRLGFSAEERRRLAVHESGHTTVGYYLAQADPVHKVSIIPRGRALGGTQQLPEDDRYTLPEGYLKARLAVMLGGRAAEQAVLGDVSSGADDDIHQATRLARAMITRWGMSEEIGPMDLREDGEVPFLGQELAQPRRYSEHSAEAVDHAVKALLDEAAETAHRIIGEHRRGFDRLADALEREETLHREQIRDRLEGETAAAAQPSAG